jgi:hypothetical protein
VKTFDLFYIILNTRVNKIKAILSRLLFLLTEWAPLRGSRSFLPFSPSRAGPPGGNVRKKRCQISAGKIIIFSGSSRPMTQGPAKTLFNIDALVKSGISGIHAATLPRDDPEHRLSFRPLRSCRGRRQPDL